jgi:UDP-N-acetylmuramate: L-alanyl-gamma-D-glutamyl-meso-diaminopimelate ligase
MEKADHAIVYYNPKAIEHKGLKMIEPKEVKKAFGGSNIKVFTDIYEVMEEIQLLNVSEKIILVMSSGNLGGLKIEQAADDLLG